MPSLPSLSHPETYRNTQARTGETIPLSALLLSVLTRREQQNRLPSLSPEQAARLYDDFLRGNLAEIQLAWEQMEDYDPTLSTCLHARQSALAEMSWRIEPDQTLLTENSTLAPLAEQQRKLLATRLRAVENLEDALVHLGTADFRGVAALEITGSPDRQKWCVIEPWHLLRPVRRGPWFFNPDASTTCPNPETLLQDRVIIRESRPIDLAAMFLVLSKTHALQGWDGFLDIYGLPSIFAELPPSIPAAQAAEFDAVVRRIVGDGRGTVPSGTKFQTVETTKDNAQAFEARAKWCDDALIKLALGGLLTVQAESGSGTLAGSAHSDSFARLCAASARSISRAVDTQYCRPILRHAFPGQPILVHFTFGDEQQEDHAANAALLATARTAGWQPDAATASTLLGFQASPAPEPSSDLQGTNDNVPFVNNAAPAGRGELANSTSPQPRRSLGEDGYLVNRKSEDSADNQQLSPAELAAFQSLASSTLNPSAITTAAATAEQALAKALQAPGNALANTEDDAGEDDALIFDGFSILPDEVANCNQFSHDPDCDVKQKADEIRQTPAGQAIQGILDTLHADASNPSTQAHSLNPVNDRTAGKAMELGGVDISRHDHVASPAGIQHARKRHPELNDDDFMLIPDILDNWDELVFETRHEVKKLLYRKTYGGKKYELVETIGRTPRTPGKQRKMHFTTIYGNQKPGQKNGGRDGELPPAAGS